MDYLIELREEQLKASWRYQWRDLLMGIPIDDLNVLGMEPLKVSWTANQKGHQRPQQRDLLLILQMDDLIEQ